MIWLSVNLDFFIKNFFLRAFYFSHLGFNGEDYQLDQFVGFEVQ